MSLSKLGISRYLCKSILFAHQHMMYYLDGHLIFSLRALSVITRTKIKQSLSQIRILDKSSPFPPCLAAQCILQPMIKRVFTARGSRCLRHVCTKNKRPRRSFSYRRRARARFLGYNFTFIFFSMWSQYTHYFRLSRTFSFVSFFYFIQFHFN